MSLNCTPPKRLSEPREEIHSREAKQYAHTPSPYAPATAKHGSHDAMRLIGKSLFRCYVDASGISHMATLENSSLSFSWPSSFKAGRLFTVKVTASGTADATTTAGGWAAAHVFAVAGGFSRCLWYSPRSEARNAMGLSRSPVQKPDCEYNNTKCFESSLAKSVTAGKPSTSSEKEPRNTSTKGA